MTKLKNEQLELTVKAVREFDTKIADNRLGVLTSVSLTNKSTTKSNIFITIIGIIFGAFTGHGFIRVSDDKYGVVFIGENGLDYFEFKGKDENMAVELHLFFPYSQLSHAIKGRSIVFTKELRLHGTMTTADNKAVNYRLDCMHFKEDLPAIETITSKLAAHSTNVTKSKRALNIAIVLAIVIGVVFASSLLRSHSGVSLRTPTLVEGDTYTDSNFELTFVSDHIEAAGDRQGTNVIVVYFDYYARRGTKYPTHSADLQYIKATLHSSTGTVG